MHVTAQKGDISFLGMNSMNTKNNCRAEKKDLSNILWVKEPAMSPRHEILFF